MPLVPALCTQCGSKLEIDSSQEAAVCPYCHTPFVTEKAINNYNTTNVTNIGNLHADVVNVSDDQSRDNRVKSGETFIKMNDYASAQKIFSKLTEECPYDYRGWWGLIQVYSENFTDMGINRTALLNIETIYSKACTVATAEEKDNMNAKYRAYYDTIKNDLDTTMNATNQKIKQLTNEFDRQKSNLESRINDLNEQEKNSKRPSDTIAMVLGIGVLLISIIVGLSDGIGTFFAALFLFGLIATGVGYVVGGISDAAYDKKIKSLNAEISSLRMQLNTLSQEHNAKIAPLNEILGKVGVN